ncbi:Syntaxin-6 [Vanrija pseudolonga]|uniref:Syntaxin-6 n=1 Tax=Vanrija pseudolonga TaxID=143232 RepID=A0AAF0YB50_9TREE|nr:Syntaxin-6 [Vanrija pseudolonga]
MATDPYVDAKGEVEASIRNVNTLLNSYARIRSTSTDSASLTETIEELQTTLGLLETDLDDLEESVSAVEENGDRWGISDSEVRQRRAFVNRVTTEVQVSWLPPMFCATLLTTGYRHYRGVSQAAGKVTDGQVLIRRQDDTLGVISGTLNTIASQAGLIGQEVVEHSEMLDDLSSRVDGTQSRLSKVTKTMQNFITKNEDTRSSWCIGILVVVLIILLIAVILV